METVDNEHTSLYELIADGDAGGASKILGQHIANVREHAIMGIKRVMDEKDSCCL